MKLVMWEKVAAFFSNFLVFFSACQKLNGSTSFYREVTDERVFPFQAHSYKMRNKTNIIETKKLFIFDKTNILASDSGSHLRSILFSTNNKCMSLKYTRFKF